jgi:TMEM175 potassium channel family protein
MGTGRLEAFSDGVIAIIITIMVLELKVPHGADLAALRELLPVLASYVLSFVYVAIYWNNHHHLLHACERINGAIMWANMHLLFWLSLIPFVTSWVGDHRDAPVPAALYGVVLLMAGVAYVVMERQMVRENGPQSMLAEAVGRDRKGLLSMIGYGTAIALAFVSPRLAELIYALIAVMWIVPDRRIAARATS